MRGGGLLVVNLTLAQPQNDLEIVSPIDDPGSNAVSVWSGGTAAFTHGTGTIDDPYLVESAENLAYISDTYTNCYFKQMIDINLGGSTHPWTPIATGIYYYDGNNKTISGLYMNDNVGDGHYALFNCCNGYIKNLSITNGSLNYTGTANNSMSAFSATSQQGYFENCYTNINITGDRNIGGIVGAANGGDATKTVKIVNSQNSGVISGNGYAHGGIVGYASANLVMCNCSNTGSISSSSQSCGGLAGYVVSNSVTITGCSNTGDISGPLYIAGLVGYTSTMLMTISNCENTGNISTGGDSAGIIGWFNNTSGHGTISNCQNYGNITATQSTLGGIIGRLTANIDVFLSSNEGSIQGLYTMAGIIGWVESANTVVNIFNCHNCGDMTGTGGQAAGIISVTHGTTTIKDSYNEGEITTVQHAGGIVGRASDTSLEVLNCYNIGKVTSRTVNNAGGIVGCSANLYMLNIKNCYNNVAIKSLKQASGIVGYLSSCNAMIENCYNLGSIESTTTDGNSNSAGILGLIESYGANVTISNCFNTGNVKGNQPACGGIVGREDPNSNRLYIQNCYNTGAVTTTTNNAGGIVGWLNVENDSICEIYDCYNTGKISAATSSGGIFGSSSGNSTMIRSYNTGQIVAVDGYSGGICGYCRGNTIIDNCYNTGAVSAVNGKVGGIVGYCNEGGWSNLSSLLIKNCYNASSVTNTNATNYIGGILGSQNRKTSVSILYSYYSTTLYSGNLAGTPVSTSEQILYTTGSSGLSTDQMKSASDGSPSTNFNSSHWTSYSWNFVANALPTIKKTLALPEVLQTFVYDGTAKTLMVCGFDTNYMTISGNTATNAGTYTCTLTLKSTSTSVWEDGTTTPKTLTWTIDRATIDTNLLPTQSGNLNYTGNSQNVSWSVFDSTKITAGGVTSGTNAGTYKAVFTPTANYKWADGTTEGKTVEWSIGKQVLTNPSLDLENNETTFTGTTQDITNVLQDFNPSIMTLSGVTQALRAGTYVFVVEIKDEYQNNYVFGNGKSFLIISWTILPFNIENGTVSVVGN